MTSDPAAALTARDGVLEVLRAHQVRQMFGNPGTTELALVSHLPDDLAYVLCLQESIAVSAATGQALIGGRTAVANLHARPGLGHAIGAIDGARQMQAPLVLLVGQQHSGHLHRDPLLSGDLVAIAGPVTKWAHQPGRPADVPQAVERAFRIAAAPPFGPTLVAVPMDFWDQPARRAEVAEVSGTATPSVEAVAGLRYRARSARSPALVTGDGLRDERDWDAAVAVAGELDLVVYSAPTGTQPGFPTGHPRHAGVLPLSATAVRAALRGHDLVIVAGAPVFTMYLHDADDLVPPGTTVVSLSADIADVAAAPAAAIILAPPGETLAALAGGVPEGGHLRPREAVAPPAAPADLRLATVLEQVAARLPLDAVVIDESMTSGAALRGAVDVTGPRRFLRTSNGVLGTGLPAAVGAAMVPDAGPVVAFVGDGSLMFAPQALWTAARWNLDITVVVLDNGGYESLRGYDRRTMGEAAVPGRYDLPGIDVASLSAALGVPARAVTDPADLPEALDATFGMAGPRLVVVAIQ